MKRKNAVFTSLILFFAVMLLGGCEGLFGPDEDGGGNGEPEPTPLTVGTDPTYEPFEYIENGELTGFDIELMATIADRGNYALTWETYSWNDLFPAVESASVDAAIAAITITDERQETMDFTVPYYSFTNNQSETEDYGVALPPGQTALKLGLDEIITELENDGTIDDLKADYGL